MHALKIDARQLTSNKILSCVQTLFQQCMIHRQFLSSAETHFEDSRTSSLEEKLSEHIVNKTSKIFLIVTVYHQYIDGWAKKFDEVIDL